LPPMLAERISAWPLLAKSQTTPPQVTRAPWACVRHHALGRRSRAGRRDHLQAIGCGALRDRQGMGGPFDRAVGPCRRHPALRGDGVCSPQSRCCGAARRAARPRQRSGPDPCGAPSSQCSATGAGALAGRSMRRKARAAAGSRLENFSVSRRERIMGEGSRLRWSVCGCADG
jgi:hypothetical protein